MKLENLNLDTERRVCYLLPVWRNSLDLITEVLRKLETLHDCSSCDCFDIKETIAIPYWMNEWFNPAFIILKDLMVWFNWEQKRRIMRLLTTLFCSPSVFHPPTRRYQINNWPRTRTAKQQTSIHHLFKGKLL